MPPAPVIRPPSRAFPEGITSITRENTSAAEWMDFAIIRIAAGRTFETTDAKESAWVLMSGAAELEYSGTKAAVARTNVFDEPPTALHLGRSTPVAIHAAPGGA